MINKVIHICVLFFLLTQTTYAQFINLQLTVEPEISTEIDQELNFGILVTNSGIDEIELGDIDMGIFNIKTINTQELFLSLSVPEYLQHINPAVQDRIPINLDIAYNNSGSNNPFNSSLLLDNEGYVNVLGNGLTESNNIWQQLYVYVFGSVDVGDVQNGTYNADVVLHIEYQ